MVKQIVSYEEMLNVVNEIGFLPLTKNRLGLVSLEDITDPDAWYTRNEADPWGWRVRVARDKSAMYLRLFDKKPVIISLEWIPFVLAAYRRRSGMNIEEMYRSGKLGSLSYNIYECLKENGVMNTDDLKKRLDVGKKEKSKFDNSLVELQNLLEVVIAGASQRINKNGEPFGWFTIDYSLVDEWVGDEMNTRAQGIEREIAVERIRGKIREIAPGISEKDMERVLCF